MNWYIGLVVLGLFAAVSTAAIAVIVSRSKLLRIAIVALFLATVVVAFAAPSELLSRAKPASWAWLESDVEEAEIRGVELREGEAIYLMLLVNGEPRLYMFPWNQQMAENILQAMAEAEARGTTAVLGKPFKGGNPVAGVIDALKDALSGGEPGDESMEDREPPQAYPRPPQALPPKTPGGQGLVYDRDN